MFLRFDPVIAFGCGCGGAASGTGSGSSRGVGPSAPGYTSTKREAAPKWDGPTRRRPTETPKPPEKP